MMASQAVSNSSRPAITRVEVVTTVPQFQALEGAWNRLFTAACNPSPPLHQAWLATWLAVYGDVYLASPEALRVVCVWRDEELVAALPLYLRKGIRWRDGGTQLCFISTGELEHEEICPDYLDMLAQKEAAPLACDLVGHTVFRDLAKECDRVVLSELSDESVLTRWVRSRHSELDVQMIPRGACPIADLSGGMERYFDRLSSNSRQNSRRLMRTSKKAGLRLDVATANEVDEFIEQLIVLHQQRWESQGRPGCFSSERFTRFHRKLIAQWHGEGHAMLSRLREGDRTIAVKYGFRFGTKYDFYQSGISTEGSGAVKSPGIASLLLLMEYLSENGVTAFDFLRGASGYKHRLATTAQPLMQVLKTRWTWPTVSGGVIDAGFRLLNRVGSVLLRRGAESAAIAGGLAPPTFE